MMTDGFDCDALWMWWGERTAEMRSFAYVGGVTLLNNLSFHLIQLIDYRQFSID